MTSSVEEGSRNDQTDGGTGMYVYGIVPSDVEVDENARGVGDPPAKVGIVREGDIAALVSAVPTDQPLGAPQDLQAHAQLLDGTAAVAPVLPLQFGSVMTDEEAVATELLREHHDEFAGALKELEGRVEYIIKGRYDEKKLLSQLLESNDEAAALRDDIRGKPEAAARDSRMALGELISNAIEASRHDDTQLVINATMELADQVNVREPTHEWDAVHLALLIDVERQGDLEALVERLRQNGNGLADLRLLGPVAPYDFVVTAKAR